MPVTTEIPGDYNLFFDNFDTSNFYLPSTVFDTELPVSLWSRPDFGGNVEPEMATDAFLYHEVKMTLSATSAHDFRHCNHTTKIS